ncbi:hypothetical protein SADUNF_Sadunf18G0108000 [Salix dunnii]|uniref:Uncharacterized protein n=1 Tax=Salix dunnii TaxID=1413687 RepID=A0A835J478_9ROSI|nr:hypothetical protein SADUNF_Sadunf18G0108000 [Salix dunnii]
MEAKLKVESKKKQELSSRDASKKKTSDSPSGSLQTVLKQSDWMDMLLMALGIVGSVVDGSSIAIIMIILSDLMNRYSVTSVTIEAINKSALTLTYVAVVVASGSFLVSQHHSSASIVFWSPTEGFCWARTAERQTFRLRRRYLQAVLRQDVGFFDKNQGASLASQVANFISNTTMFITGQLAAIYLSWRLAIVAIPALLMLIIPGLVYGKLLGDVGKKIQEAYGVAGGIVEQAVSSIRTVYSYVAEERTSKDYKNALKPALELGIKQGLMKGMAIGTFGITFAVWALQGWYGSTLVIDKGAKGGNVYTAGLCTIYGGLALGGSLVNVKYFIEANIAAARIFEMIHRVPEINSADEHGKAISDVKGEVEFRDIDFEYPSRPGSLVLNKFNLKVMAGQTVGLVGASGSGKSTVINLLERFYEPLTGDILLDGVNIKSLPPTWLRNQMGLVSQEPVLFATSINENILFGKEEASMEEVIGAAKAANAHNFICKLPQGYKTLVGQMGNQMSEGQKQRISIARALLRDPKILLLDEATSALDSQSEKAVQDALNRASIGRTTIIIAHRLSTLRNADLIAVIQYGQVGESGSHEQLMQNSSGTYAVMVQLQRTYMNDEVTLEDMNKEHGGAFPLDDGTSQAEETPDKSLSRNSSFGMITNQQQEDDYSSPSLRQLISMTAPEWKSTLIGCVGALGYGLVPPLNSFFLGALLAVYFEEDHTQMRSQIRIYCFVFLGFAVFTFLSNVIQHYYFGIMGETLTERVREEIFEKILTFEIEWFDQEDNSSGAICARLATDAVMVRTLVTDRLSLLTQAVSSATLAVVLAFMLSWRLAIVAVTLEPGVIAAIYLRGMTLRIMSKKILKAQVVHWLEKVLKLYDRSQVSSRKESNRQSWYAGVGLFISQFLTSALIAVIFWYGGKLLFHRKITYKHLFQIFFILISTGRVIAETATMTSDLSKGTSALKSIFRILQRETKIVPENSDGIKPETINGEIEFKQVYFIYPARPKQIILRGLDLKIEASKIVALVGRSGSGKSTIIRLIERFYDTLNGSIDIDGINIMCYNLRALRSHIALVSQEPTLFAGTIHDNIAYAKEKATEAEIIEAATIANAHDFIRITLARAILKNPAILLLDEATSALDVNSEKLVQEALQRTMSSRTCLVVAHRLSTIQKADKIVVIDKGRVIEEGNHGDLLARGEKGAYYSLVKLQQLSVI